MISDFLRFGTEIDVEQAKKRFPFIGGLSIRRPDLLKVYLVDFFRLERMRPSTLEDNTIHGGREHWELFGVEQNGHPRKLDIRLGRDVIYHTREFNPYEDRDDIHETGESAGEALARDNRRIIAAVLYGYGRTRFSLKDISGLGEEFETLFVSVPENSS